MKYMNVYKTEFPLYLFCRKSDARYKHKQKLIITVCYFEMLWDDIYRFVVNSPILFTIIIVISTRFCQGKELMIRQQITRTFKSAPFVMHVAGILKLTMWQLVGNEQFLRRHIMASKDDASYIVLDHFRGTHSLDPILIYYRLSSRTSVKSRG